ncbi:MAG TPA: NAD-dependent epimerase [Flavobacteriaceae bacterium]|nr:NAD-dependent epimerase [Flavobacteriaceae bacterium]HAT63350.1 NAD-dependent epimerase [Flavobacteriaceae bacterium]|tara:strand:- start:124250 stop:125251 length:1002 start_codon:yes stop_codon:yes gene_type:complete
MILVTGGTGLVGAHLLYHLVLKHPKVRATHRASSDLASVKKVFSYYTKDVEALYQKIEWVAANITEIPQLTQAFQGITHVYHCAAFVSFNPKHYHALKKANIEGTANVVNIALANDVKKMCYVSSIATLGKSLNGESITEETPWNPEDKNSVYSITKYGAEMEVWRGTQEGLDAVIVNPGVILGEGYWHSSSGRLITRAAKGVKYYTEGSSGFVDIKDVVKGMVSLMESDIKNERFVLVSENLTYKEFLGGLSVALGKPAPSKSISKRTLLFLSSLDWLSSTLFGTKRRLLKGMIHSMFTHSKYDASKIEKALDFQFTPYDETITRIVKNYNA